jgi:hypothetical protein
MWGNQGGQNLLQPNPEDAYAKLFYDTYEAPGVAQLQTDLYNGGQQNSSFGGAELGTAEAQGHAQAGLNAQQYYTNSLNNWLNERSNYYNTAISGAFQQAQGVQGTEQLQLQNAQNSAQDALQAAGINSQQNQQLAQFQFNSPYLQNQYGLSAAQLANNFAQGNYQTGAGIYGSQLGYNAQTNATNSRNTLGLLGK